jgi:chromosome segregation ATPase
VSFLLLDSSSFLLLESDGSKLLLDLEGDLQILGGDFRRLDQWLERKNEKYREAKAAKEKKENEIIEARLKAQQLYSEQKALEKEASEQSIRQAKAITRQISGLDKEIVLLTNQLNAAIAEINRQDMILAEVLLMDADPFFSIGRSTLVKH